MALNKQWGFVSKNGAYQSNNFTYAIPFTTWSVPIPVVFGNRFVAPLINGSTLSNVSVYGYSYDGSATMSGLGFIVVGQ